MFSACPTSFAKKKQKLNYNGESCLVLEKQFALFETFAKGLRLTAELVEDRHIHTFLFDNVDNFLKILTIFNIFQQCSTILTILKILDNFQ